MFIKKFITVVVLVYLYSQMVLCNDMAPAIIDGNFTPPPEKNGTGYRPNSKRQVKLYNECSGNYLKITNKLITANGESDDPNIWVEMESSKTVGFTIMGFKSKRFMCFNKKGELKSRHKGRKKLCKFTEVMVGLQYRLRSVFNKTWEVGFDESGRPVVGSYVRADHNGLVADNRFVFVKRPPNYREEPKTREPVGPVAPDSMIKVHKKLMQQGRNKGRRRRRRSTRAAAPPTPAPRRMLGILQSLDGEVVLPTR